MTKEKRMEPPRLILVPSSQESHDHAGDEGEETARPGALPRNVAALPFADHREKLRILEALLFAAAEPLDEAKLASHLAEGENVGALGQIVGCHQIRVPLVPRLPCEIAYALHAFALLGVE